MNKEKLKIIDKLFGKQFIDENNNLHLLSEKIDLYEPKTTEELIKINNKTQYRIKIKLLKSDLETTLKLLNKIINRYRELYNKTELFEEKTTYDFNFKDWNTIKKANGKLTRYFNELRKIYLKLEIEDERK